MQALITTFLVITLNLVMGVGISVAYTPSEIEIFDNEPPIIKDLLERASVLLTDADNTDSAWKAANLYCEAAR